MPAEKGNGRNAGHAAPAKTPTKNTSHFTQAADLLQAIKFVANSQASDALVSGVVLLCGMLMVLAVGGVQ